MSPCMHSRAVSKVLLLQIAFVLPFAGQQLPVKVEFEVASIKPAAPDLPAKTVQVTGGEYRGRNLSLFELITTGWQLNQYQLIAGPKWIREVGWGVDAKLPDGANSGQLAQMMQVMLADRFQLVVHRETRNLPIYLLTLARGGPKLHDVKSTMGMSVGPRLIRYGSVTMDDLAGQLSGYLGRNVLDRTGLTGEYAIDLSFAPVASAVTFPVGALSVETRGCTSPAARSIGTREWAPAGRSSSSESKRLRLSAIRTLLEEEENFEYFANPPEGRQARRSRRVCRLPCTEERHKNSGPMAREAQNNHRCPPQDGQSWWRKSSPPPRPRRGRLPHWRVRCLQASSTWTQMAALLRSARQLSNPANFPREPPLR